jgi:hypothetical protein
VAPPLIPDIPMVAKNQMKGFSTEKSIFETIFILNTIKISIYNIKALKHPGITKKNKNKNKNKLNKKI